MDRIFLCAGWIIGNMLISVNAIVVPPWEIAIRHYSFGIGRVFIPG